MGHHHTERSQDQFFFFEQQQVDVRDFESSGLILDIGGGGEGIIGILKGERVIAIDFRKDVDGVTYLSYARTAMNEMLLGCATPLGIMKLLDHYNIPLEGREAVVVGRSPILGKPMAAMLLNRNATVTVCHSKTRDLPEVVRRADIVVGAVGKPKFIQGDWIKEGAVVVDAGYNPGNVGDVDLEAAAPRSSAYTPVPGGVGPMCIATLIAQTVQAAETVLRV